MPVALPDDLVALVLQFLDSGLDWIHCRQGSHQFWHSCVLAIDKKPGLWMAPMRLFNLNDWNDRLQADCSMVQRVPAAERERLLHLWNDWNKAEGDDGNPNWFHDWRWMDLQVDDMSMHSMEDSETREPIVSARLSLLVRGA